MDRSKAAIAAVFGAVTVPKTPICCSKLCFPGRLSLCQVGQGRGKRAGFRGAPRDNLQAPRPEASRTSPVCPQDGFCSPEMIRERNSTATPTYWASHCSQTQGFAGRRQVEEENPFDAGRRSDPRRHPAPAWAKSRIALTTGLGLNNAIIVPRPRPSTSSLDGRALAGLGGKRWHRS